MTRSKRMRVLFFLGLAAAAVLVCVGEPVLTESLAIESGKMEGENPRLHVHLANRHFESERNPNFSYLFLQPMQRQFSLPLLS